MTDGFGAARAAALVADAESWDLSATRVATTDDIPVIDVERLFATGDTAELDRLADQLRYVGENVGFHFLVGHGIGTELIEQMFEAAAAFLTAPATVKQAIAMDSAAAPIAGIGYMALGERRLPERSKGNLNEAALFKQDRTHRLADNMWPDAAKVPGFRETVSAYAAEIERVAMGLLPVYARALELPADYFDAAFTSPFYRLRMTRYAPVDTAMADEFGIAPHVDTTFFTLLAQNAAGLTIYGEQQQTWLRAPVVPGALVVNTGELLKQWSNDRFLSVKHYVPPHRGDTDRYSVPFFFNATADYPMACLSSCTDEDNPPRYPTVSYLESQAAAQHE
jgi:isopenicillin N synthase-like dioxygenase